MFAILFVLVLGFAGGAVAHSLFASKVAADVAAVKADLAALKAKLP